MLFRSVFFFEAPKEFDLPSVQPKWNAEKVDFFKAFIEIINAQDAFESADLEANFKALAAEKNIKIGELMLPFRIMLVGGKFGPQVFDIATQIGKQETISRIENALTVF